MEVTEPQLVDNLLQLGEHDLVEQAQPPQSIGLNDPDSALAKLLLDADYVRLAQV